MATGYPYPAAEATAEVTDRGSRFLGLCAEAGSVEAARTYVAGTRQRFSHATHHVFAFAVGHGATVTHGMSDDGEPSGTAGRPVLAVVQGSGLGDVVVVVVRWFGGTKLGTGGLVRAYTKAAQGVLAVTPTARRVDVREVVVRIPYERYHACREILRRRAKDDADAPVEVVDESFGASPCLRLRGAAAGIEAVLARFRDVTGGRVEVEP